MPDFAADISIDSPQPLTVFDAREKPVSDRFLDRREAAEYLTSERGLRISKNTLGKMATLGGGPPYRVFGIRAVYTMKDLDEWAAAKLSAVRRSTSELC